MKLYETHLLNEEGTVKEWSQHRPDEDGVRFANGWWYIVEVDGEIKKETQSITTADTLFHKYVADKAADIIE